MDLYRLPKGHPKIFPEGYRFSWIAYDPENPLFRVLFDCHPPKGPHVHVDDNKEGDAIEWISLEVTYLEFFEAIRKRFGEFLIKED